MERRELLTTVAGLLALGTAGVDHGVAAGDGGVGVRRTDTELGERADQNPDGETVRVDVVLTDE
jgi:hypothetical protein